MHDIGKLRVDKRTLKDGKKLSHDRLDLLRSKHVDVVSSMLGPSFSPEIIDGVMSHHERFDGQGYPLGLEGEKIPLIGKILKVADEFQTKIEPRPFRKTIRTVAKAWSEMMRGKEHSFDPIIVDALGKALRRRGLI